MPDFDAQDLGVGAMRTSRYQADIMILVAQATIPMRRITKLQFTLQTIICKFLLLNRLNSKPFGKFLVSSEHWVFRCAYN
jgi:hypothetical protein